MKILIVDDNQINLKLLNIQLASEGNEVLQAADGVEAMTLLEQQPVDAVVSDILMPRMDGYRLCHAVRAHPRLFALPFIFYTATYTSPSDEKFSLEVGADKFLKKPAPVATIINAIREIKPSSHPHPRPVASPQELSLMKEYSERLVEKLEQKNMELLLQTTALETAANCVMITNRDGQFLWVNPAFTSLTGYGLGDLAGKTPRMLKSGRHDKQFYHQLWDTILSGRTWRGEFTNRKKDGSHYFGEQTITPVRSDAGTITHFIGIMNDITDRKRTEQELRQVHEELRRLLEHSPAVIYKLKIEGQKLIPVLVSENIQRLLGVSVEEATRYEWWLESLHPEDRDRVVGIVSTELQHQGYSMEYRIRHKDGSYRWVEDNNRVIQDASGRSKECVGVWMDITERKKLEAEVSLREKQLNSFFTGAAAGLALLDTELRYLQVNETLAEMNGVPRERHLGRTVAEVVPALAPVLVPMLKQVLATGNPIRSIEVTGETARAAGVTGHWMESFFPVAGGDEHPAGIGAIIVEITHRRSMEAALRESEERFRQIAENVADLIAVLDLEGRRVYNSPSYRELFGDPALLRGTDSFQEIHPEDRARIMETFRETIRTGIGQRSEYRFQLKDGSIRHIESQGSVIRDKEGRVSSVLVVSRDVTEKKRLQEQFLRAQRMESIGTLAGGIAHDLNNVLSPILMAVDILKRQFPDERSQYTLNIVEASAKRGSGMVRQVLTFARGAEGERGVLQPKHLIDELVKIARETFPKSIQVKTNMAKDLWTISGDATQLHQVLLNLCVNARDAMPNGGDLNISAENVHIDENYARMHIEATAGAYVILAVTDTGMGIPRGIIDKIFDPFFTTKEVGKGTGLGLSTVHTIVKSHGGWINVYSEPGKGTRFQLYLPALEGAGVEVQETQKAGLIAGEGEMILLADDEASIRDICKATLESFGYRVMTVNDGAEAVALYAQHRNDIDLVITDMMMPYMDGPATIRALRKINPALKIIGTSGFIEEGRSSVPRDLDVQAFLAKPYSAEKLLKILHEVIAKS